MNNFQKSFDSLVKNPTAQNAQVDLEKVAVALWYKGFVPKLDELDGVEAAQAGYVLDKLSRYNCLDTSNKVLLRAVLTELELKANKAPSRNSADMLANKWGASADLKKEFRTLLPLQRRNFSRYQENHAAV
ncbi:hypothetical protein ACQ5ES_05375 [Pseudidiomarina sp. E22-M8]|uniref:hypothetical protein n=1 Tax=Pseudidiomarina sp. E22-M8 TaxID=3424768 RepID=UPI00403D2F4C